MFTIISVAALFSCAFGSPQMDARGIDERIVGGHPVRIEDHPYQIFLKITAADYIEICGGSIISEDYIVTAAHCIYGSQASNLKIRAGSRYREGSEGQERDVAEIHQHPKFDKRTQDYDIAILALSESLQFGNKVQAIRLPSLNQIVPVGTECIVTGWGDRIEGDERENPKDLLGVSVPLISDKDCKSAYKGFPREITPRMICAGHKGGMKDACSGDSGGPLMVDGILVGVVSWGKGCARPNVPGVFARVANKDLRDFISDVTGL